MLKWGLKISSTTDRMKKATNIVSLTLRNFPTLLKKRMKSLMIEKYRNKVSLINSVKIKKRLRVKMRMKLCYNREKTVQILISSIKAKRMKERKIKKFQRNVERIKLLKRKITKPKSDIQIVPIVYLLNQFL